MRLDPWPTVGNVPTEFGPVELAFTNANHVCVTAEESFKFRNTEYRARVHLYADAEWETRKATDHNSVTKRHDGSDAAPTYRRAIIEALTAAVRAYVAENPDILREAEYQTALRDAQRAKVDVASLTARLDDAKAALARAHARMAHASKPASVQ